MRPAALSLPLIALAATAGAAVPDAAEPYPAREVLEAFGTACSGIEIIAVARASVLAAGWEEFEPGEETAIGRIVAMGEALAEQEAANDPDFELETITGGIFRKDVSGRELFAVISGAKVGDIGSYGCRIFDLTAPAALTSEEVEQWAVREPQQVFTGVPGGVKFVWNPGLKPGHMEMEVSFVPQGTVFPEPLSDIPLSGLVLTASALEFLDQ